LKSVGFCKRPNLSAAAAAAAACIALQLEEVVTVHKKHTSALEKALRCLDNDAITSEEIDPLKDDLDYYLVSGVWDRSRFCKPAMWQTRK
jgi:CCR4-NOT transcriptional regulation complex NOT5 subunit